MKLYRESSGRQPQPGSNPTIFTPRFFVWWKEMNVEGVLLCVALFVIAVWL